MMRRLRRSSACILLSATWAAGIPAARAVEEPAAGPEQAFELFEQLDPGFFEVEDDAAGAPDKPDASSGGTSEIQFSDGNTLHGSFAGLDSEARRISWKHADADAPLSLPLSGIRSISLQPNRDDNTLRGAVTVKFTGADWMTAMIAGFQNDAVLLQMPDGSNLSVGRSQIEWIFFSQKGAAPDCYEGPTSMIGWNTDGSWAFKEGGLRALRPSPISRVFEQLPDKVDYLVEIDQKGRQPAFSVNLRGGLNPNRANGANRVQLMFSGSDLRLWAQVGDEMKMEQVDLGRGARRGDGDDDLDLTSKSRPTKYRILEDFTGGRIIVFIEGRKIADWKIAKGEAGKNTGGISFQPMVWDSKEDQSINRLRVMPWDGRVPDDGRELDFRDEADSVTLKTGEFITGKLASLSAEAVTLETADGPREFKVSDVTILRLKRPENPPEEDPSVGHLRLASSGEFDVTALELKEGRVIARTAFAPEINLPDTGIRYLDFPRASSAVDKNSDTVVFRNGDRLPGKLGGLDKSNGITWFTKGADESVNFAGARVASVLLGPKADSDSLNPAVVARFDNADLLSGELLSLDAERAALRASPLGPVTFDRRHLQALYFSGGAGLPVLSGSIGSDKWTNAWDFRRISAARNSRLPDPPAPQASSPWRYFDGNFVYRRVDPSNGAARTNTFLGRILENMPQNVEIAFSVFGGKTAPIFSAQLFTEPESPGYMLQFQNDSLYIHDMAPRQRAGGVFQQQVSFEGKLKKDALRRDVRVLAERNTGRLVVIVDDVVLAQIVRKTGERGRGLGRGLAIYPQTTGPIVFSNLWIGPWDGRVPGESDADRNTPHSVLLANGDESLGIIGGASPELLHFESDVGEIEMPLDRVTMLRFGEIGKTRGPVRLHLRPLGAVTVSDVRIEEDRVVCKSELLGDLSVPLSGVQEIAFPEPLVAKARQ